ncbi:alpha/beta hydrolase family esterase [Allorhizocola rhizosphaerae]|uniref:alpha/beta hydrolase family esterase n=1 Tax=Allorhizocola rhizosphaerae TaxID=1872709 RepID=UPI000E3B9E15|nr:PHB depolymerase family esterase [Allorhizocola rhizosphaerae]
MRLTPILAVLALAAGCSTPSGPSGPAVTPTSQAPQAKAETPAPGDHVGAFTDSKGTVRRYLLHAPPNYARGNAYPLVMVFHGQPGTAADMPKVSGMNEVADANGFLVVYPDQTSLPEAVGELIDHITRLWGVDPKRVHASGFFRGANVVYEIAEKLPGRFGSVAPVAGTGASDRPLPKPVSLLTFQGGQDRLAQTWTPTNDNWAKAAGCTDEKVTSITMEGGPTHIYTTTCAGGTEHVVYSVTRMGHTWPADAGKLIWEFFTKHPLRT